MKRSRNPNYERRDYDLDYMAWQHWDEMRRAATTEQQKEKAKKMMAKYAASMNQWGSNPTGQLLFSTRAAAVKYAKSHGAKKYSIRKLKRG